MKHTIRRPAFRTLCLGLALAPLLAFSRCGSQSSPKAAPATPAAVESQEDCEREERTPRDAARWRHQIMVSEDGTIPDNALMKAIEHRQQMTQTDFDTGGVQPGSWNWVGPGNVGGRARSLWIQPSDPRVLVLGSCGGGIWRSEDSGVHWEPVADFPASLAISCMAGRPGSNTSIWAGTGEGFSGGGGGIRGAGIFRSVDSGRTFYRIPGTDRPEFNYVNRIAFSPIDPQIAWVATESGLWRTSDAGSNIPTFNRYFTGNYQDVKYHPTDGNRAVCAKSGEVRYSSNASAPLSAWKVSTGIVSARRIELAWARSHRSRVYASAERIGGGDSRVYRSDDSGESFVERSATGILGTQGFYDNAIWVDPTNSSTIVVGGISLFRSTDGGLTFTDIRDIHADQHLIVHVPGYDGRTNKTVYVCNDGGIYRTSDILTASTSSGWTNLNNRVSLTQFYGGSVSPGDRPFGGTQDNGTQQLDDTAARTFRLVRGKDGMKSDADQTDASWLFGETQYAGLFRSRTAGAAWEDILTNMTDTGRGNAPWVTPLRLDPNNPNRLWVGSRSLWRTNNAKTLNPRNVLWQRVRSNSEFYSSVDVAVGNSSRVVAATRDGEIFITSNGTDPSPNWTEINTSSLPNRFIASIRINPKNFNQLYVVFGGFHPDNAWYSPNAGLNWFNISGTGATALPSAPCRSIAVHPRNQGWLYVGTEIGMFASTDNGATWSTDNDGPATVPVTEIVIQDDGDIFAFTYGRGVYRAHAGTNQDNDAQTSRATLSASEVPANDKSDHPTISGNGRYVAFGSDATNLWTLSNNGLREVFVRDRQAGKMSLVSVHTSGDRSNGHSDYPDISTDGRFVAFQSLASNLAPRDVNQASDIFVHSRVHSTTERVSVSTSGTPGNGPSYIPSISADGRFVVYSSTATNLVPGDGNGQRDVFRYDRHNNRTFRVSLGNAGFQANSQSLSTRQAVSANGAFIVFRSDATNLVTGDTNGAWDIFLRDMSNPLNFTTTRVSVSSNGTQANNNSFEPSISADGRYIAYYSLATNLVPGDTNAARDVFLYDRLTRITTRISTSASGDQGDATSWFPMISDDGSTVVFQSSATNLVPRDTNGLQDVFAYRRNPLSITRISVDSEGTQANNLSEFATPSENGQYAAFVSGANNLVNNDVNGVDDVFVHRSVISQTVYPKEVTNISGSATTSVPFSQDSVRLQQVARDTDHQFTVRRLSFRRSSAPNNNTAFKRQIDLSLQMGRCDIDALTTQFSQNWQGAPSTVITRKQFNLPDWRTAPSGLARFDASLPLDLPHMHAGTSHLMWEIRVFDNSGSLAHPMDAHSGNLSLASTSTQVGTGCVTPNSRSFGHSFVVNSDGPTSSITLSGFGGPSNTPTSCGFGISNPNLLLPGFCTRLYTDAAVLFGIGSTNSRGSVVTTIPGVPWEPAFRGLTFHTQLLANGRIPYLSSGQRVVLPTRSPGPLVRRIFATPWLAPTGTLQNLGAVFKIEN